MILEFTALGVVCGLLYHMGGGFDVQARQWWNSRWSRRIGCPLVCMGGMFLMYHGTLPWWSHFFALGTLYGCLVTYWDGLFADVDNFWFHGLMCGLAYFPYAIATNGWLGLGARCVIMAVLMGSVSLFSSNVRVEEIGRGAILAITLPLLLV